MFLTHCVGEYGTNMLDFAMKILHVRCSFNSPIAGAQDWSRENIMKTIHPFSWSLLPVSSTTIK